MLKIAYIYFFELIDVEHVDRRVMKPPLNWGSNCRKAKLSNYKGR